MQNFENKRANQKCCTAQDQTSLKRGVFYEQAKLILGPWLSDAILRQAPPFYF